MKNCRKEEILLTARTLFNEYGYTSVTMRTIADALHISVGNLTYYYKKKEDLAEAVILEQQKSYHKFENPRTLEELNQFFVGILRHQEANFYYYRHYAELAELSPRIYEKQKTIIHDMFESLQAAFQYLDKSGRIKPDEIANQTELLIEAILSLCIYGAPAKGTNRLRCLWSLIFPVLTEQGRKDFRSIESKNLVNSFFPDLKSPQE